MSGPVGEVAIDLQDMVAVLQEDNQQLMQQNAMLRAAVLKLRREADEVTQANGQPTAGAT